MTRLRPMSAKATGKVSAAVMASRVLGLARDVLFAALFPRHLMDVFFMAYKVPNLLRDLFAEGALSQAFVTTFSKKLKSEGETSAWALANKMMTLAAVFMSLITSVRHRGRPMDRRTAHLAGAQRADAAGLRSGGGGIDCDDGAYHVSVHPARLAGRAGHGHAERAGNLRNAGAFIVFFQSRIDPRWCRIRLLAGPGVGPAGAAGTGVRCDHRRNCPTRLPISSAPQGRLPFRRGFPMEGSGRATNSEADGTRRHRRVGGAGQRGGELDVRLQFAGRLGELVNLGLPPDATSDRRIRRGGGHRHAAGLVARGSRRHRSEDFKPTLAKGLRLVAFLVLPSTLGLVLLAEPIVSVLYERGAFDAQDRMQTAAALRAYGYGLLCYAWLKVLQPGFYAIEKRWVPMLVSLLALCVNIGFNWFFVFVMRWGHESLALTTSISATINFIILYFTMRKYAGDFGTRDLLALLVKLAGAGAAMAAVCLAANRYFFADPVQVPFLLRATGLMATTVTAGRRLLRRCAPVQSHGGPRRTRSHPAPVKELIRFSSTTIHRSSQSTAVAFGAFTARRSSGKSALGRRSCRAPQCGRWLSAR